MSVEYDAVFQKQLQQGIIERVPEEEEGFDNCYFLPHHGVVREDKETTKLRVVFDGSARAVSSDYSLNDCLDKGPNFTPHIFDILVRFRIHPIGIVADIEKAFHQIAIDPKDRDMLRFLWSGKSSDGACQYRFCRLMFGLTPSPAILNCVIQHHLTRYLLKEPKMVRLLTESFYVDDFVSGAANDEEVLTIYQKAKEMMKQGGFNLRKWKTN